MWGNPSDREQTVTADIAALFERPRSAATHYVLTSPQRANQDVSIALEVGKPHAFTLKPFEVLILDAVPRK